MTFILICRNILNAFTRIKYDARCDAFYAKLLYIALRVYKADNVY